MADRPPAYWAISIQTQSIIFNIGQSLIDYCKKYDISCGLSTNSDGRFSHYTFMRNIYANIHLLHAAFIRVLSHILNRISKMCHVAPDILTPLHKIYKQNIAYYAAANHIDSDGTPKPVAVITPGIRDRIYSRIEQHIAAHPDTMLCTLIAPTLLECDYIHVDSSSHDEIADALSNDDCPDLPMDIDIAGTDMAASFYSERAVQFLP
jgi:hypothetical protein